MTRALIFLLLASTLLLFGCTAEQSNQQEQVWFDSYLDIPGISEEQIQAIRQLREQHGYFLYGMVQNDEAVYTVFGEVVGFSARMSDWLSNLFGIPFIPVIHDNIGDLMEGFENDTVHFTGQFPRIPALEEMFAMTDPISKRSVAIARAPGSRPLSEIIQERDLHILFTRGSALHNVLRNIGALDNFVYTHIDSPEEAAELMLRGEADAYISDGVLTVSIAFPGFRVEPFYPFVFGYASFSAQNPDFIPIVDAVQKILDNGGMSIIAGLYAEGTQEVNRHRMNMMLTEQERDFLANNPVIPIAVHGFSYPISFYNEWYGEIQGMALDILSEIELILDVSFEITNPDTQYIREVRRMLADGEAFLGAGPFRPTYDEPFPLSSSFFSDSYILLSRSEMPIIGVNEILYMSVGLVEGGIFDITFQEIFPNHLNIVRFDGQDAVLDAVESGEVDLAFMSMRGLLRAINLLERPDFRANLIFDETYYVSFAISYDMPMLASIIDSALTIVDTQSISDYWMSRTFDFSVRVLQAQQPLLIATIGLFALAFTLLFILFRVRLVSAKREKAMILKLEEALDKEKVASNAKSDFLSNMSHEIRTPMNAIIGMAAVAKKEDDNERKNQSLEKVDKAATHLLGIINSVLDMSRIEANKMELKYTDIDIRELLKNSTSLVAYRLEEKHHQFSVNLDNAVPLYYLADEQRITQILVNLLVNAATYTPDEGEIGLTVTLADEKDAVCTLDFEVSDSGIGISPEFQERVFNAFERTDGSMSGQYDGIGLGLSISKKLAELMGGTLRVESELGKGARFIFSVGLTKIDNAPHIESKSSEDTYGHTDGLFLGKRLLLAEDVDINREVLIAQLDGTGLTIDIAENGKEAVSIVTQNPDLYDLILMDVRMPEMDGLEATRHIRSQLDKSKKLPIIAMTAHVFADDIEQCLIAGMDDHIGKPFDIQAVIEKLRKYLL